MSQDPAENPAFENWKAGILKLPDWGGVGDGFEGSGRWAMQIAFEAGAASRQDEVDRLSAIEKAALELVEEGREWIGGTKYCPDCLSEGWHHEGCERGQRFWTLRQALADAVNAVRVTTGGH